MRRLERSGDSNLPQDPGKKDLKEHRKDGTRFTSPLSGNEREAGSLRTQPHHGMPEVPVLRGTLPWPRETGTLDRIKRERRDKLLSGAIQKLYTKLKVFDDIREKNLRTAGQLDTSITKLLTTLSNLDGLINDEMIKSLRSRFDVARRDLQKVSSEWKNETDALRKEQEKDLRDIIYNDEVKGSDKERNIEAITPWQIEQMRSINHKMLIQVKKQISEFLSIKDSLMDKASSTKFGSVLLELTKCEALEEKIALWNGQRIYNAKEANSFLKVIQDAGGGNDPEIRNLPEIMNDFYRTEQDLSDGAKKVEDITQKITSSIKSIEEDIGTEPIQRKKGQLDQVGV